MCSLNGLDKGQCSSDRGKDAERENVSENIWNLICIRAGEGDLEVVCENHFKKFLVFYEALHPKCEDPKRSHTNQKRKAIKRVTEEMYLKILPVCPTLYPGKGLCNSCYAIVSAEAKKCLKRQIADVSTSKDSSEMDITGSSVLERTDSGSLFQLTPNTEAKEVIENLNIFLITKAAPINFQHLSNINYATYVMLPSAPSHRECCWKNTSEWS